jgi:hypothetical protein
VNANIVYQDNTSAMKLKLNGKGNLRKTDKTFDIKIFYFTDFTEKGEMQNEYCPTNKMIADYITKPLVGSNFTNVRNRMIQNDPHGQLAGLCGN